MLLEREPNLHLHRAHRLRGSGRASAGRRRCQSRRVDRAVGKELVVRNRRRRRRVIVLNRRVACVDDDRIERVEQIQPELYLPAAADANVAPQPPVKTPDTCQSLASRDRYLFAGMDPPRSDILFLCLGPRN